MKNLLNKKEEDASKCFDAKKCSIKKQKHEQPLF